MCLSPGVTSLDCSHQMKSSKRFSNIPNISIFNISNISNKAWHIYMAFSVLVKKFSEYCENVHGCAGRSGSGLCKKNQSKKQTTLSLASQVNFGFTAQC